MLVDFKHVHTHLCIRTASLPGQDVWISRAGIPARWMESKEQLPVLTSHITSLERSSLEGHKFLEEQFLRKPRVAKSC